MRSVNKICIIRKIVAVLLTKKHETYIRKHLGFKGMNKILLMSLMGRLLNLTTTKIELTERVFYLEFRVFY